MSEVAKVIQLHDVDVETRHRSTARRKLSQVKDVAHLLPDSPVTSLTARLAEAAPRPPQSLGEMVRGVLSDGIRGTADFARRRLTGDYQIDEFGLDEHLLESVMLPALRPLADLWFRVQVAGIENVPESGGALLVVNHAGVVPLDGLILQLALHDRHPKQRTLRLLAADLVLELPFIGGLARKAGHTLACPADAERLLRNGELTGVFPEGFKGVGKNYSERYRLQRFGRGGFVSAAVKTGVPIIPVSIVGSEEIYPKLADIAPLARLLGLPYFPVTPLFPHLGPIGMVPLPSKWYIEFGTPISTAGFEPEAADDPMTMFEITDQVRETIQLTLYKLLTKRRNTFLG
ncbi:lysophospholipid acyltransferase family protein [Nocardia stercoris]|uniref:Acyltransferase family protein n=1 Tax=Nocardia stercoris TaxID=2483361 RepID=A0A3M2L4P8_9NOCA|nr:lysophospholipid acyltransferase family protein [Nocardia stercoris]RMI30855.1 acyltransferase family protein [Nocardia stercoris]